jgi:hypothetical protein
LIIWAGSDTSPLLLREEPMISDHTGAQRNWGIGSTDWETLEPGDTLSLPTTPSHCRMYCSSHSVDRSSMATDTKTVTTITSPSSGFESKWHSEDWQQSLDCCDKRWSAV